MIFNKKNCLLFHIETVKSVKQLKKNKELENGEKRW